MYIYLHKIDSKETTGKCNALKNDLNEIHADVHNQHRVLVRAKGDQTLGVGHVELRKAPFGRKVGRQEGDERQGRLLVHRLGLLGADRVL